MAHSDAYRRQVHMVFEAALAKIAAEQRGLSSWEAECLLEAVKAMAFGNYGLADAWIGSFFKLPKKNWRPKPQEAEITLEGLRDSLAVIRRLHE